jgi:hypothetical protein
VSEQEKQAHRYTDRDVDLVVIESIEGSALHFDNGWSFGGVPPEVLPLLTVGGEYLQETHRLSLVTGMATCYRTRSGDPVVGQWLWHKTDADLDRELAEMLAESQARYEAVLAENRSDWSRREAALPLSLRRRLERFRANGGHGFDVNGWGYELVICELAVLYAESHQADTEAIEKYASLNGTSGNQHDYAKALSRHLNDDPTDQDIVANSVSALAPLTGDADYSSTPSHEAGA